MLGTADSPEKYVRNARYCESAHQLRFRPTETRQARSFEYHGLSPGVEEHRSHSGAQSESQPLSPQFR